MSVQERKKTMSSNMSEPGTRLIDVDVTPAVEARSNTPALPEGYEGKTMAEVVEMHQAAISKLGKQGNEVGALRRELQDIRDAMSSRQAEAEAVDFWDDPERAIDQRLKKTLSPILEQLDSYKVEAAKATLTREFPDWEATVGSEEFQNWVAEDESRLGQFREAHYEANAKAAISLLKTYNQVATSERKQEGAREEAVKRDRNLRASVTEGGTARQTRGKRYSRSALIALQNSDRDRYNALLPEIEAAYKAGRVDP